MAAEKDFIRKEFYNVYQKKWKAQGRSQEEFAAAVREIDPECGINKTYVSKLLNGIYTPSAKYLKVFCEVLGIDLSEFYPSSDEDKYRYSSEYQDKVSEWKERVAKESFGLNLSLLYGLKELIDFDSEFPIYAPLECVVADPVNGFPFGLKYERAELAEAAEASRGNGLFQLLYEGKVISLSPADLKYLKMIQNYIVRKIREQFSHHRQELIDSMNEASETCREHLQPGKRIELGEDPLSPEQLQKVDKWGIYTEAELKRYKIPDSPPDLPYTAAHIEKDTEIHIGRGALPPDELWAFFVNKREKKGGSDDGKAR